MPTEQLTYAQIAKHLSVSPEAARAIVKRHRLPRSRRNDGKTLAAIDLKEVKGGVDYWITPELKLGTDVIWVSRQWFVGDDANQNPKLADYWVANLHGSYQLTKEVQIYGVINNLFNRKFATFGTFFDPQSTVANAIPNVLFDHRTVTPAQPLSVYVGMRAKL
jgi:iron complex outermembrane recepter protein